MERPGLSGFEGDGRRRPGRVVKQGEFADYEHSRATLHRRLQGHAAYPAVEELRTGKKKHLYSRFEAAQPHECWQLDGKGPFAVRLQGGDTVRVHVLSVLDDYSRSILAALVASAEDTRAAIEVFQKAALRYGLPTDTFLERDENTRVNDIWTFLHDPAQRWYFNADLDARRAYVFDTLGVAHGATVLPGEAQAEACWLALRELRAARQA